MGEIRDRIIAEAAARAGMSYRLEPPPDGVNNTDCSLYVLAVMEAAGVPLPGVRTAEQIRQATVKIPFPDVLPGDLLFFERTYDAAGPAGPDGKIASHIGISLGAGSMKMWNAVAPVSKISDISSGYWQEHLFDARRLPALVAAEPTVAGQPDPWQWFSAQQIADITQCPVDAVRENWPRLVEQMGHCGNNSRPTQIAMAATVAIESARTFEPVREAFWLDEDWRAANLTYYPYYGRGFIQLTLQSNYETYGPKIAELWDTSPDQPDFNLAGEPDRALDPDISAAVSALYFRDHGGDGQNRIPQAAAIGNWAEVRRLVQGGSNGLPELTQMATALWALPIIPIPIPDPIQPPPPTFDRAAMAARLRGLLAMIDDHAAQEHAELTAILATVTEG